MGVNILNTEEIRQDFSGRTLMNTVFGEQLIGQRVDAVSAQFMYGIDLRVASDPSANGGYTTIDNAMLEIHSGTDAAGDGIIQSLQASRYLPGKESYCFFTTIFTQGVANNDQQVGLFEENNGFYIGYKGDTFGFTRLRNGVENFIPHTAFDVDILSDNKYGVKIDPTKGNVWKITYGYLGFANIFLEVLLPKGEWVLVHKINYPNSAVETSIGNTYLPIRGRSINSGNTTDVVIKVGSISTGLIDGVKASTAGRYFSHSSGEVATVDTGTPVITYRVKDTFFFINNFIPSLIQRAAFSTDGAQNVTIRAIKNMTITNSPTWTDVDSINSTIEYTQNATITAGTGFDTVSFELGKSENSLPENLEYLNVLIYPGDTITFWAEGNNNVRQSLNWIELF